jgi:predicted metal-binding membrane protein
VKAPAFAAPPRLPGLIRVVLIGTLLVLATIAWVVTDERMAGMDMGPGTDPGALGFWISSWVVMMAAMMFPSIAPMVVMYARIQAGKRASAQGAALGATAIFVAGYLLIWSLAGLVGYTVLKVGHEHWPRVLSWDEAGPYVAGGVIVAAAIYQLTPLKNACLSKCRDPFAFLFTAWRPGRIGGLRMGIAHGGWCVGCCWALMAALIALGAMSVGWMLFIASLIAMEKLVPWKKMANHSIAILLAVLGLAVAFAPDHVPGLTEPNRAMHGPAMTAPGMDH